jgi:hypothetical protein
MARDEAVPLTHLGAELLPESLIKIWLAHGKKGVTEQSRTEGFAASFPKRRLSQATGV